ncbi:unnamed protein product, partial [Mesorhabditis spiculigera]
MSTLRTAIMCYLQDKKRSLNAKADFYSQPCRNQNEAEDWGSVEGLMGLNITEHREELHGMPDLNCILDKLLQSAEDFRAKRRWGRESEASPQCPFPAAKLVEYELIRHSSEEDQKMIADLEKVFRNVHVTEEEISYCLPDPDNLTKDEAEVDETIVEQRKTIEIDFLDDLELYFRAIRGPQIDPPTSIIDFRRRSLDQCLRGLQGVMPIQARLRIGSTIFEHTVAVSDCVKEWTLCPGKDGILLCTLKQYLIDPESGTCDFIDCPVGELPSLVGDKRNCLPRNRMTNGTLPERWWWDGCIYDYYINCGNYVPVCLNAAVITAYNASAGGCINEGCPPATHPCKGENGTECIAYDDLKSARYKKGGDVCVLATAEEKAAARPTPAAAAQEKTEPKETSPASSPSCYAVSECIKEWTLCPGKDGVAICTRKDSLLDPESADCAFKDCPMGLMPDRFGARLDCLPLNRLTNGSLPDTWTWDGCAYEYYINCGSYLPVCISSGSLEGYNVSIGGCIKEGCPPGSHPCKAENGTDCIAYDDLKSLLYKDNGYDCVRATPEEKAAARPTVPSAAQEKTEPKSSSRAPWLLVNSVIYILTLRLLGIFCSVASGMMFVYLLVLVLYTGELSAENTTLSTDVCPKDSDACKGCTGSWVACPGKDGAPICSKKYNQVDPKGSVCQYKECPVGEGQILVGKGFLCVPFKHFVNGTLPGSYLWEGCEQKMRINCGTWTPICFEPDLVMSYNDSLGGCIMEGYLKPAKECAGLKNTLACWAANDDYTCIGFERINSMTVDKHNKTICTFAKCTGEDALLCSAECQSIHEVKRVLPGGECEYRTLRRGQIIMIISCSIIGTVAVIAVVALLTRVVILQKNRNKPIEHRPSSMENKHQDGDSNEKRPFLPSKNPKAFNEKPQV